MMQFRDIPNSPGKIIVSAIVTGLVAEHFGLGSVALYAMIGFIAWMIADLSKKIDQHRP